jgi:hypothetical protein
MWDMHNMGGGKWFKCTLCVHRAKHKSKLTQHLWVVHSVGDGQWFQCARCEYKTKCNSHLTQHLWSVHNEGDGQWFQCTLCEHRTKHNSKLTRHLRLVHNEGDMKWFQCTLCEYKTKQKSNLKRHTEYTHDIGQHRCQVCELNRNSRNEWVDRSKRKWFICRDCYQKATGKTSRVEKIWSDYIDKHLGTDFLMGSDIAARTMGGCSLKRPDKLYGSLNTVEHDECDEHEHWYVNGSYMCEEKRLTELYDEPSIFGKKYIVIRWNPHRYTVPTGKVRLNLQKRLALMVYLKQALRDHPPLELQSVFYICYSHENPQVVRNMPVYFIYDTRDVDEITKR